MYVADDEFFIWVKSYVGKHLEATVKDEVSKYMWYCAVECGKSQKIFLPKDFINHEHLECV